MSATWIGPRRDWRPLRRWLLAWFLLALAAPIAATWLGGPAHGRQRNG